MSSLVLELQQDALNTSIRVADLLRKSLLVARKLNLKEFEDWVNHELNGYKDYNAIPEYRELYGSPVAYSPYHGWYRLMIVSLSPNDAEKITMFRFHQPLSYFESSLGDKTKSIVVSYETVAEQLLARALNNSATPALEFNHTSFQGVLDAVRNIILEWTLRLESEGIVGENMTFTVEEKHLGASTQVNIQNLISQVRSHTEIGEVIMRDTYKVGQAGAVGANAHAHDMNFNQIWNQLQSSIDLPQLAGELARLRQEMKKEAAEPEHDIAVSDIARAEQSAKSGDGSKTLEHLRSAGKWAIDVATKIGLSLAVEAIEKSMDG